MASQQEQIVFDSLFLKKLEYLYIVSKRLFRGQWKGERRSFQMGSSVEFKDYRNYVPGDDLRHLDWNIFKRLGKLLIKLYEEEEEHYIYLLIDVSRSMDFGVPNKLTYAKKVAAALAYIGLSNQDRVSLATFHQGVGEVMPFVRGKGQIFNVFEFLNRIQMGQETQINESLKKYIHQIKRRGIVILLSDLLDPDGYENGLKHFVYKKFDTYILQILDDQEIYPAKYSGDLKLIDSETGEVKEVAISKQLLVDYSAAFLEYCQEIRDFANSHNITYLRTSSSLPFEDLILQIFRKGGFLQ